MVNRSPADFAALVGMVRDDPETWHVYSTHLNMAAAHNRASRLRGPERPLALMEYERNIEFRSYRHEQYGPCVLVRWHITEGTVPPLP